jgi:hypothetical protein
MAQVSNQQVMDLFKKVYGGLNDLRPETDKIDKLIPFENSQKIGDSYIEAFILGDSTGITFAGQGQDAFAIRPAIAGSVQQSNIKGNQTVLSDIMSFAFMARGASTEAAFKQTTGLLFKTHIESHNRFLNVAKMYGQAVDQLGYISYAPSGTIYRGATYTGSGTITLTTQNGNTIAFTNGINAAQKAILLAPGQFAAGHWTAKVGVVIKLIDSNNVVLVTAKLVSYDVQNGILFLDQTPVAPTAATGAGSVRICYDGWELNQCMVGMKAIMSNQGTLFGINAVQYPLWAGNVKNLGGRRFNLKAVFEGVSNAVNAGGLDDALDVLVNPRTFGQMANDEASFRKYDSSYKPAQASNGFEAIEYYAANGVNRIMASPLVKEGDAFGIVSKQWRFSGSQLPSFKVTGLDSNVFFPLSENAGWCIRSYADAYLLCRMPARQILWTGLNDEGIAYE